MQGTGVTTLLKTNVPYDFTSELQLAYPPEGTAQPVPVIGTSFVSSSSTPSLLITNAPGHAIASMTPSVTQHHPAEENSTHHPHVHWPSPTANGEHQNSYLHGCTFDVVKDTSDSNSLPDTLNLSKDPIGSGLAIPGNEESVPSYAAVFGQSTVEKCTLDHFIEPSLTSTASRNDGSSMAMFSRGLVSIQSTFDPLIDLPTNPNDPVGLVHEDHLLPTNNVPMLAHGITFPLTSPCIGDRTLLPQA